MPTNMPSRKTFSLNISIGLVTLALDGYSSTEESATRRATYIQSTSDGVAVLHPVGMTAYDKITGTNVAASDCIKCVESADGTLVPVSDEEMSAFMAENGTSEFVGFIDRAEYQANYVEEKLYQVRPTSKIAGRTVKGESPYAKPFALFTEVMRTENVVGIVKFVQRGNARYYGWLPDGTLRSLRYDEEVRAALPLPLANFSKAEVDMGKKLVAVKRLKTAPVLEDETSTKITEFVEKKAKAMADGQTVVLPEAVDEQAAAPTEDLMALLSASLS